jgi:hypothetical protein
MSLAIEKIWMPATGHPAQPAREEADQQLKITVVFTSVESTLAKQFRAANAAAEKAQAACQREAARGSRFEEELASLRKVLTTTNGKLQTGKRATEQSKRRIKELEERVSRKAAEVKRAKAELAGKVIRRTRQGEPEIGQNADLSQMDLRVRDSISALARATADLEKERRRLEGAVLPSGCSSLDAARLGRAFVNSFRSQLQMPADNLMQSIRRLLEMPLEEEEKKLVQSAFESALLVQAGLQQEPGLEGESAPDKAA